MSTNADKKLILGYHANRAGESCASAIMRAVGRVREKLHDEVIPCIAMFIANPRNGAITVTDEDIAILRARSDNSRILWHGAYTDLPASANIEVRTKAIKNVMRELDIARKCNSDLNVHITPDAFADGALVPLFDAMREANKEIDSDELRAPYGRLFLECGAAKDTRLGDPVALNHLFDSVVGSIPNIGLCIDTAHVWASGAHAIAPRQQCGAWFRAIRKDIPVAMHLNDSKRELGCGSDIHTVLGQGEIWRDETGYIDAIHWARSRDAPVILERNESGQINAGPANEHYLADVYADMQTIMRIL